MTVWCVIGHCYEQMASVHQLFVVLYEAQADAVFRFCRLRLPDRETALDLTQDIFMRLWVKFRQGHEEIRNPRALLFTIARNRIIDHYRAKKSSSLDKLLEEEPQLEALLTTNVASAELASEARELVEHIAELEPIYQQVVYLGLVEGFKPQEIAEIIGERSNNVSVRLHRGLAKLRELGGYDLDDNY